MNFALQKTLELLILIGIGFFLQKKVAKQDLKGVKEIILSVALPATIFVALLKKELKGSLLIFPLLALAFNFMMLLASKYLLTATLPIGEKAKKRTLMMLLPSLAPGLSCFPFIVVYLGDDSLALAALSDVGNKIFVLILLYILAMRWHRSATAHENQKITIASKLKGLLLSLLNEPINMVIVIGLALLGFGVNLNALPGFFQNTVLSLTALMTPLVLLFIGMAVRIKSGDFRVILSMLVGRAGLTFCLSAVFVYAFPNLTPAMILLLVVFPQSSSSFWPFAHMSAINSMEENMETKNLTFDTNFAVNVLAFSLPFSTLLIIGVFSFSDFFIEPNALLGTGLGALAISFAPHIFKSKSFMKYREEKWLKSSRKKKSNLAISHSRLDEKVKEAVEEAKAS